MNEVTLSYVLTTRNRLPFLKETLPALIAAKKDEEEILIGDGASTDGSAEYLKDLFEKGKIDYLISEPDSGEAHGFNKLIARANGTLIKLITDDDAFYYPNIEKCKEFMLAHPEIDFLSTDGVKRRNNPRYLFSPMNSQAQFNLWLRKHVPFSFCGLGIMVRKSSLPLIGYLHTGFTRVDAEYALRVTASKAHIAWYTGETFAHILNQNSNSTVQIRRITEELERLEAVYLNKPLRHPLERKLRDFARPIKNWIKNRRPLSQTPLNAEITFEQWLEMYGSSVTYLENNAKENNGSFLH